MPWECKYSRNAVLLLVFIFTITFRSSIWKRNSFLENRQQATQQEESWSQEDVQEQQVENAIPSSTWKVHVPTSRVKQIPQWIRTSSSGFFVPTEQDGFLQTDSLSSSSSLRGIVDDSKESVFVKSHLQMETGVSFIRNVTFLSQDFLSNVNVDFDSLHCSDKDEYGSNVCHYSWGEMIHISVTSLNIITPLQDHVFVKGSFKVDSLIDWGFSCPVCGQNCTFVLPVANEQFVLPMPPCPLDNTNIPRSICIPLDDKSPTHGIPSRIRGQVHLIDTMYDSILAEVSIQLTLK